VFHFQQFTIQQSRTAMKVGTDAVCLGAWAAVDDLLNATNILDIGTGTGVLSLMLAQKISFLNHSFQIDAVEMDEGASLDAIENVRNSVWNDKISVFKTKIQDFYTENDSKRYDLIISNPPFFEQSLGAATPSRHFARHTDALPIEYLIYMVSKWLSPHGKCCLVFPIAQGKHVLGLLGHHALSCSRLTTVFSKAERPPFRLLLEIRHTTYFLKNGGKTLQDQIVHRQADNSYTDEFKTLTQSFYLLDKIK
jgi:tRNA1Val (adenine37-N6)-methyltransferase